MEWSDIQFPVIARSDLFLVNSCLLFESHEPPLFKCCLSSLGLRLLNVHTHIGCDIIHYISVNCRNRLSVQRIRLGQCKFEFISWKFVFERR